jgi:hypothetical protein
MAWFQIGNGFATFSTKFQEVRRQRSLVINNICHYFIDSWGESVCNNLISNKLAIIILSQRTIFLTLKLEKGSASGAIRRPFLQTIAPSPSYRLSIALWPGKN